MLLSLARRSDPVSPFCCDRGEKNRGHKTQMSVHFHPSHLCAFLPRCVPGVALGRGGLGQPVCRSLQTQTLPGAADLLRMYIDLHWHPVDWTTHPKIPHVQD